MILLWLKVNIIRYWIENTSIVWSELVHMGLCSALYIDIDGPVCSHLEKSLTCQLVIWWLASTDSVTVINCSCFEAHRSTLETWFSTRGICFWICVQCSSLVACGRVCTHFFSILIKVYGVWPFLLSNRLRSSGTSGLWKFTPLFPSKCADILENTNGWLLPFLN